jgi:hypothetical protein
MLYELWAFYDSASPVPGCTLLNAARASVYGASAVVEDPKNFLMWPVTVSECGLSLSYPQSTCTAITSLSGSAN